MNVAATRPVCLIVLAWNGWAMTRRMLDTLLATEIDGAEVLVVDNGSTDGTASGLSGYTSRVRVLRLPKNCGFVRGNNAGIAAVDPCADIVLLNNDLEFTQRDWLVRLRACARAGAGIVGCRLVGSDGRLQHAGSLVLPDDGYGVQLASGRAERDVGQYAGRDRNVQGIVFAVAYLRREVIDAIGPLNEAYDTYFEDTDYCLRARVAGFATVLCGGVTLLHRQHGSTGADVVRRQSLYAEGHAQFVRDWREMLTAEYRRRLLWRSALDFPPRYAALSRPLLRALDRAGVDLRFAYAYETTLPSPLRESGDSHDHVLNTIRKRPASAHIAVTCAEPAFFAGTVTDYRIGYAAFDVPPSRSEVGAWDHVDEAWVPSEWHAEVLREAGVAVPVSVVPFGIDVDYYHPQLHRIGDAHGDFVFICAAAWDKTDRPWIVLRAFNRAFRRRDPVRLLAWLDGAGVDLLAATRELSLDPHGGRISFLPDQGVMEEQRGLVFRAADAFVSASCGAARHLPLLQAMAVGLPVIAPRVGALQSVALDQPIAPDEPIEAALIERMLAVTADSSAARVRGLRAGEQVRATLSIEHATAKISACLDAVTLAPRRIGNIVRPVSRGVFVLGMHRSGTSCVAGLLQMMGLFGGRVDEFLAHPDENPFGFFERADLHAICVTALRERGGDWSIPLGWSEADAVLARINFRVAFQSLLAALEVHGPWFVKEPRLCLLAPELFDLADVAAIVHVVRNPIAVARSIVRRDGLGSTHALALWEYYQRAILTAARGRPRILVDYDALQAASAETAARLYDELTAVGLTGLRALQPAESAAWVRPEFDHGGDGASVGPTAAQLALWRALVERRETDASLEAASESLLRQLYEEHRQVLARERNSG